MNKIISMSTQVMVGIKRTKKEALKPDTNNNTQLSVRLSRQIHKSRHARVIERHKETLIESLAYTEVDSDSGDDFTELVAVTVEGKRIGRDIQRLKKNGAEKTKQEIDAEAKAFIGRQSAITEFKNYCLFKYGDIPILDLTANQKTWINYSLAGNRLKSRVDSEL